MSKKTTETTNHSVQIVVPCANLELMIDFLTETLGFRLEMIMPADSPDTAVMSGYGINLRLETSANFSPPTLRLVGDFTEQKQLNAPNGMRIDLIADKSAGEFPRIVQEFIVSRNDENAWEMGRAGMEYRDLIPGRLGGGVIASHIRIVRGGMVPDYVHYHKIRFQLIYCKAGWAKLVYEDQGEPFVFRAGDCVLQPSEIRHRVLETSDAFEVIEIGSPAIHPTFRDHDLILPTGRILPERDYNGQKFVRHIAANTDWNTESNGFESRETGIFSATGGLVDVRILRTNSEVRTTLFHDGEFLLLFVLAGEMIIGDELLGAGDCCTIPAETEFRVETNKDLELLRVLV